MAKIKELQDESNDMVISFFSLNEQVEMSTMLLRALMKTISLACKDEAEGSRRHTSMMSTEMSCKAEASQHALLLAINWNRVDISQHLYRTRLLD